MNILRELAELKPNSILDYFGAIFIMVSFFLGASYVWKIVNTPQSPSTVEVRKITTCENNLDEFLKLKGKGQFIVLSKNQWSHAVEGKFEGDKKIIVRRGGDIACGYLYVKAHKSSGPLSDKYDSIYINPQGFGGHLLRTRAIKLNRNDAEKSTEVLFDLKTVSYLPSSPYNPDAQNFEITDWVKLLNAATKVQFWIALSTLSESAVIDEAGIAYRCWNPDTMEETEDCQLSTE